MKGDRGRVVSEAAMRDAVAAHRAAGRRITFTNGAFDLLHVGHVRMLADASSLGDVLVVAVNDDVAVRASKGPGRPLVPAAERAELVAAVAGVDLVVVFSDRTVDRLLEAVRPDVHAKGRDYAEGTHPEAPTNRRLGVRMAFVGDAKGHAASDTAGRLRASEACLDLVDEPSVPTGRGLALRGRLPFLAAHGLGDLEALLGTSLGTVVLRHKTRSVRRIEVAGEGIYVKAERPTRKGSAAVAEMGHHLALRAAGFRAPEPWLALDAKSADGRPASVLVTREARGLPLDRFLAERLPTASGRERAAWARGIGVAIRALHTARFLPPDLLAWHLVVDGSPAGGTRSLVFLDLARLARARGRVGPREGAPGLAALALSLRPVTDRRFRLAILRAYLGGRFRGARLWTRAIDRRIRRVEGRGTFRGLGEAT